MKLVVYSNESVDKMAEIVDELFSGALNKDLEAFKLANPPFDASNLNNIYKMVPIKSIALYMQIRK